MARRSIINKDETNTAGKPVNTDSDDRPEAYGEVHHLEEHGIIDGYSDGTFESDDAINRGQMAKIANLDGLPDTDTNETTFTDSDHTAAWAEEYISEPTAEAVLGGPWDSRVKGFLASSSHIKSPPSTQVTVNNSL